MINTKTIAKATLMGLCIASITILTACGSSSSNDDTTSSTDHRTILNALSGRSLDIRNSTLAGPDEDEPLTTTRLRLNSDTLDSWHLFPYGSKTAYNDIEFIRSDDIFHDQTINNVEVSTQASSSPQNTEAVKYTLYEHALLGQTDLYARTFEEEHDISADGSETKTIEKTDLVDGSYYEHRTLLSKRLSQTEISESYLTTITNRSNGVIEMVSGTQESMKLEFDANKNPTKERLVINQTGSFEYLIGDDERNLAAKITYSDIYISSERESTWFDEGDDSYSRETVDSINTSFNVPLEIEVFKDGETYTYDGQLIMVDASGQPTNRESNASNFMSELHDADSETENPVARMVLSGNASEISIYMYDGDTLEPTPIDQN